MARRERDWGALVAAINELHALAQRRPRSRKGVPQLDPGSILNAYREGDVTHKQAVRYLKRWARRQAASRS